MVSSSTLPHKSFLASNQLFQDKLHLVTRLLSSTDLFRMTRRSVICRKLTITCCKSVALTQTWPSYFKCSMFKTSTTVNQRVNVNSLRLLKHRSSSSTKLATCRCEKKSSLTFCLRTSIAFSQMWTTCSSSRSSSQNTMQSTPSSPTSSTRLTNRNLAL